MSTTSVSELGYLFLTCPVCIRIVSDLDVKDHTAMATFSCTALKATSAAQQLNKV